MPIMHGHAINNASHSICKTPAKRDASGVVKSFNRFRSNRFRVICCVRYSTKTIGPQINTTDFSRNSLRSAAMQCERMQPERGEITPQHTWQFVRRDKSGIFLYCMWCSALGFLCPPFSNMRPFVPLGFIAAVATVQHSLPRINGVFVRCAFVCVVN